MESGRWTETARLWLATSPLLPAFGLDRHDSIPAGPSCLDYVPDRHRVASAYTRAHHATGDAVSEAMTSVLSVLTSLQHRGMDRQQGARHVRHAVRLFWHVSVSSKTLSVVLHRVHTSPHKPSYPWRRTASTRDSSAREDTPIKGSRGYNTRKRAGYQACSTGGCAPTHAPIWSRTPQGHSNALAHPPSPRLLY